MDTPQTFDDEPELETECAAYRRMLPSLHQFSGWFVLIHGTHLIGLFPTMVGATDAGYRCFGVQLFLVRKIETQAGGLTIME